MSYAIDLGILDGKTAISDLRAWVTFADDKRGVSFDLLIRYLTPAEQQEWAVSVKDRETTDADWAPWLAHAEDWRGIVGSDGAAIPFDRARLEKLWAVDHGFRFWFLREAQKFDNFRCQGVTSPAA